MKDRPASVIGIDPGLRTGMAVYDVSAGRLTQIETLDFWRVYELVSVSFPASSTLLVIEDASLNKPTFRRSDDRRKQDRLSRNVGAVQRESQLLIEGLEAQGFTVIRERPSESKWNETMFRRITGWEGAVSQHAIDAARLCWRLEQWPLTRSVATAGVESV